MQTYIILRRGGWRSPAALDAAAARSSVVGVHMSKEVRWLRSYVLEEGNGTVGTLCVFEATSPEAVRRHARLAELPVDEIVKVDETLLVHDVQAVAA